MNRFDVYRSGKRYRIRYSRFEERRYGKDQVTVGHDGEEKDRHSIDDDVVEQTGKDELKSDVLSKVSTSNHH